MNKLTTTWINAIRNNPEKEGIYLVRSGGKEFEAEYKNGLWNEEPFAEWSIGKVTVSLIPTEYAIINK